MKKWFLGVVLLVGVPVTVGLVGCDEAESAFDCHQVCSRYQTCVDDDYDVSACRDRCRTNADNDESYKDKADACEACIDDKSCAGGVFSCATECIGIVP